MATATEECFMQNPLVIWIDTFRDTNAPVIQYKDIYGGVFITTVMSQIEPQSVYSKVNTNVTDVNARIQNWDNLIKNIKAYYQEVLQQILIMRLPNVQTICREPEKDTSFEELKKALLLVLGCAVQCERKEHFIEKIKTLDIKVQHAIVEHIKEVTDDTQSVLPINPSEQLDGYVEKTLNHLNKLIVERDELAEAVLELKQEQEFYQSQIEGKSSLTAVSPEKHHLVVELADCKAKVRKLRQELEEKIELLSDVMDELDDTKAQLTKIKTEYEEVYQEAKTARAYRDESDMLREKASQVVCYENEITKYKEKLNEMEFFRSRVDELREDNRILVETRTLLEGQLTSAHKRIDSVKELERDLIKCKKQVQDLTEQRDTEKEKVRVLTEENALLEFEKKNRHRENTTLEQELEHAQARTSGISLSDQLSETSNTKVLRLELENQRLQQKLDELRDNSLIESSALSTELEKENKRLAKKVESLQEEMKSQSDKCIDLEQKSKMFEEDKDNLLQMVETVKENTDRQLCEVKREKEHLAETITALRDRNEKTNDTRLKELESENKKLHDKISEFTSKCSKLDFENQQMKKSCERLKASADRLAEVEKENVSLERRNADLKNAVSTLKLACDKYENTEQNNSRLEIENKKLSRTIESLQVSLSKQEMLIEEHISLTVENQKLQKTLESLKGATDKVLELEHEKDELNREIQQQKKTIESQRIERVKYEQMEMDILDMDNENQKLQKTLEMTTRRLRQLEQDNNDLEVENEKLQVSIETLKISCKKLENKENDNKELENEVTKLGKDKSTLEKENKKLKHVLEATEAHLDDVTSKHSSLDMEHKNLKKIHEKSKDSVEKMHEFEKENKHLQQQLLINKKTLATLREDLVNEKIQMQQLLNEREKLGQELERIGLKSEELMKNHESDDSRYQALENMMQEALNKNMEIKEEKIHSLESRLEESKNRNHKLQEELRCVKKECESLKQRYEEELHEGSSPTTTVSISNSTREILNIKDKVIEVERDNATLIAENKNLQGQLYIVNDQLLKASEENQKRHVQLNTLHEQKNSLHSTQANFQVENKTLQTQCASLQSQNSSLQTQLNNIEIENDRQLQRVEDLQGRFDSIVSDHEALQKLHDDLTTEYESLILEHGSQKSIHKAARNEMKDLQDQLSILLRDKNDVNKLQEMLEKEREQLKVESKSLSNLQMEYNQLRNKFDSLQSLHSRLEKEHHELLTDYKRVKSEYNGLQLRYTEMQGEAAENREQLNSADLEMTKLATRCEAIDQMNQKMEEENNQLLYQMKTLINQNQELLTEALNSKDQQAESTKAYHEKYAELRRQKERLEEKIMEHYKMRLESPKKRSLGATLVRKARGIITRVHRTKSKTNLTNSESPDNSSVGSGSYGDGTDADSNSGRRVSARSSEDLLNCEPICHLGGKGPDNDDGFRGSSLHIAAGTGRISPGSELLTLEQFLHESTSPSPPTSRKKSADKKVNEIPQQNETMKRIKTPDGCTGPRPVNMVAGQDHLHPGYNQTNRTHSNSAQQPDSSSNTNANNYQELNLSKVSRISSGSGDSTMDGKTDGSESHYSSVQPSAYRENMMKTSTPKTRLPYHQDNTYPRDHHCQGDNLHTERSSSRNSVAHEQSYAVLRSAKSNSRLAAPGDVSGRSSTISSDQSSYAHEKSFSNDNWHNHQDKTQIHNHQDKPQMHHSHSGSIERPTSMHFNNQYPQGSASRPMGSASPFPQKSRDACSPNLYRTDPNLSKSEISLSKTNSRSPDNSVAGSQNFADYHLTHGDKPISASSILEIRDTDENYPYRPHPKGPPPIPPPKPINRDPNNYLPNASHAASNSNSTSPQDGHRMLPTSSSTSSMLQSQGGHSRNSQNLPPSHTNTGMKNAPTARISPQTKTSTKPQPAAKPVSSSSNNSSASNNKTNDEPKDSKTNSVWTFR